MTGRVARSVAVVGLVLAALALAGCAGTSERELRVTLAALGVGAKAITPAPSTPSGADQPQRCGPVTASIRPPARMPGPGAMPRGSFMATIARRGRLIAGVDENTLLFSYFNPLDGRIEGLEIDLVKRIAQAIFGRADAVELKAMTPTTRLTAAPDGRVDLVADAITITCARRQTNAFSTAYFEAGQRVLVPSSSTARSLADLAGKRVCATAASTSIDNLRAARPRVSAYPVPERTDCLVDLQEGKVAAASTDDSILLGYEAQDPNTKLIGPAFTHEPYGLAMAKSHPEFVAFVNGVLAQLRADGELRQIYRRWLGPYGRPPAVPAAVYLH